MLLSNVNSFICPLLNVFKNRYITLTIQFRHEVNDIQRFLINTNHSIQHYPFNSTQ